MQLVFFFEAQKRIDFRDLVSELFSQFKTRIWMQQVDTTCLPQQDVRTRIATDAGFLHQSYTADQYEALRRKREIEASGLFSDVGLETHDGRRNGRVFPHHTASKESSYTRSNGAVGWVEIDSDKENIDAIDTAGGHNTALLVPSNFRTGTRYLPSSYCDFRDLQQSSARLDCESNRDPWATSGLGLLCGEETDFGI
jgi:hypothetical protein